MGFRRITQVGQLRTKRAMSSLGTLERQTLSAQLSEGLGQAADWPPPWCGGATPPGKRTNKASEYAAKKRRRYARCTTRKPRLGGDRSAGRPPLRPPALASSTAGTRNAHRAGLAAAARAAWQRAAVARTRNSTRAVGRKQQRERVAARRRQTRAGLVQGPGVQPPSAGPCRPVQARAGSCRPVQLCSAAGCSACHRLQPVWRRCAVALTTSSISGLAPTSCLGRRADMRRGRSLAPGRGFRVPPPAFLRDTRRLPVQPC
jgi:hypothetical protein